jgi:molybdopterin biosynthesis enzyme
MLAKFRWDGKSDFPFADHSAIDGHALQADHIATARLAVDGWIKRG